MRLASRIGLAAPQPTDFSIRVFNMPIVNAFALPGCRIVLTRKLIETADAETKARVDALLQEETELAGLLRAMAGRYTPPVPGGDLIRSADVLPTGRNIHAFDPFRMPTEFACRDGAKQAELLLATHKSLPRTVALVLWGSDNIKSDGAPLAQALALIGAKPRFDSFGRLSGADLIPLEELGRPRIDVVMTLSGIFRDLLPLQTRMLAEAAKKAAEADEPLELNYIRAHAWVYAQENGVDLETAALRVFSNAEGAYGSNVNALVDSSAFGDEDELADAYEARKSFAYGVNGKAAANHALLQEPLKTADVAYQNLESVELGVTTVDHYFDTLGGISRAVKRARGGQEAAIYISDTTRGNGKVRTLQDQVALETRSRSLNPKWFEGMLKHGAEGVRQIEAHLARQKLAFDTRFEIGPHLSLMTLVSRGAGWTVTTAMGYMRAHRLHDRMEVHPVPFRPFARTISLFAATDWTDHVPRDVAHGVDMRGEHRQHSSGRHPPLLGRSGRDCELAIGDRERCDTGSIIATRGGIEAVA